MVELTQAQTEKGDIPEQEVVDILARDSLNIVLVAVDNDASLSLISQLARPLGLLDAGRAWFYVGQADGVTAMESVKTLPQGGIVLNAVDAPYETRVDFNTTINAMNPSTYPGTGPDASLKDGTINIYDAVMMIADCLEKGSGGTAGTLGPTTVTREMLNVSIGASQYLGVGGLVSFGNQGYRKNSHVEAYISLVDGDYVKRSSTRSFEKTDKSSTESQRKAPRQEILNEVSDTEYIQTFDSAESYSLVLSFFDGHMTNISGQPVVFPGPTTEVPQDQTDFIRVAVMWSISSNAVPQEAREWTKNSIEWAVKIANEDKANMAPDTRLEMTLFDTEANLKIGVRSVFEVVPRGTSLIIGDVSPRMCIGIQSSASAYEIPHIATSTTSSVLSDKEIYPTFMRLVSTSDFEPNMVIHLAKMFKWTDISIVSSTDLFGAETAAVTEDLAEIAGIHIEHHVVIEHLTRNYESAAKQIAKDKPRILIAIVSQDLLLPFMRYLQKTGYKPSAGIILDSIGPDFDIAALDTIHSDGIPVSAFEGWLSISTPGGYGQEFEVLKNKTKQISFQVAPGVAQLAPSLVAMYDAFSLLGRTVKTMKETGQDPRNGTAMLSALKTFRGDLSSGAVSFDENGDLSPAFDLRNIVKGQQIAIGRWTLENGYKKFSTSPEIKWTDGSTKVPISTLPRQQMWLKWHSGAGIALAVVVCVGMILSTILIFVIAWYRHSRPIKAGTWEFLVVMLLGTLLGLGSAFVWFGKPTTWICALRIWLPPNAFLLILGPLLAKTWRLHRIFTLNDFKIQPIPLSRLVVLVLILQVIQIVICIFWISLGTIQPEIILDKEDKTLSYVICSTKIANRICLYLTYGYIGLLIVFGCYLAFKVRKLPKDFNESGWIARTMYNVFLFAGVFIILGYTLAKYYTIIPILIVICTIGICFGAALLMNLPKVWALWKHPESRTPTPASLNTNTNYSKNSTQLSSVRRDVSRTASKEVKTEK